ncbi:serine/arginine-rich splicing factor 2-like [Choloepus didactylus]|uniref:serine/arginine-rich splicing factor 2-like n=1 Tax=Choloepus didactylus TaxID=27675 RepID=UPI00189F3AFA|nr:serine/arginine-rich splicing factor 2-like [Choloepus didactylus]
MSSGRPPPNMKGITSLKLDNLTYHTTPDTLRCIFLKYREVGDVYIPRDRFTKLSRGFAFVRFHDRRHAEDAMEALDGVVLDGREIRVQMACCRRPPGSERGRREMPTQWHAGDHSKSQILCCSRSRSVSRCRLSHSKSPSRSSSRAPSTSRPGPTGRSNSRSPSVFRSRSRSRSLPREYTGESESETQARILFQLPGREVRSG